MLNVRTDRRLAWRFGGQIIKKQCFHLGDKTSVFALSEIAEFENAR